MKDIVIDPFESPFRPAADDNPLDHTSAFELPLDLKKTIRDVEIDLVKKAMASSQFNQRKAATALGLTYDQFRGYLKKYDLPTPSAKRPHD